MENIQAPFNNPPNSKLSLYQPDIIKFTYSSHIDRLQFSLRDNRHMGIVMGQLKSLYEYIGVKKKGRKIIHKFRHGRSLIQFVKWGRSSFRDFAVMIHDPDVEIQYLVSQLMQVCPMTLSEFEVACDFHPVNKYDLYDLRKVLTNGLVLKYSRPGCYSRCRGTEYVGKGGNVRKGAKGIRIYKKQQDGRYFLRIELQFNRDFISKKAISLPVNADDFDLFDIVDYRQPLDEDRLLKLLCKRWAIPIKRAADVEMLRSLTFCGIYSWIQSLIVCPSDSISDQISRFRQCLKHDNLAHRVNEFFPKSPKKAMVLEAIRNGFVRREFL